MQREISIILFGIFILFFGFYQVSMARSEELKWTLGKVIDGDTVHVYVPGMPDKLNPFSIRVYGIDTPEKGNKAKCDKERELSAKATKFTTDSIANAKVIQIVVHGHDKYGGRFLGDIIIDGLNLRTLLLMNGFAREYYGDRKKSWC